MKQYKTSAALTQYYKLPDGQMIDVSSEKIQSVEPLFAPSTLMSADDTVASQLPIHRLVHNAIARLGMTDHFKLLPCPALPCATPLYSTLPYLTPPHPTLPCLTPPHPALPYLTPQNPTLCYPTLPYPILPCLALPCLALPCLALPCLVLSPS